MTVTRFALDDDLIFVRGELWGPAGRSRKTLRLVFDTGAAETVIQPHVLDELGYNPRHGEARTTLRSAVGEEPGYLIRVDRFGCLRHQLRDVLVHAHDLPEGWNIDGLIGLPFLRQFNYQVRSAEGRIFVDRV